MIRMCFIVTNPLQSILVYYIMPHALNNSAAIIIIHNVQIVYIVMCYAIAYVAPPHFNHVRRQC